MRTFLHPHLSYARRGSNHEFRFRILQTVIRCCDYLYFECAVGALLVHARLDGNYNQALRLLDFSQNTCQIYACVVARAEYEAEVHLFAATHELWLVRVTNTTAIVAMTKNTRNPQNINRTIALQLVHTGSSARWEES